MRIGHTNTSCAVAIAAVSIGVALPSGTAGAQTFGSHYQEYAEASCSGPDTKACRATYLKTTKPFKVMKVSCRISTSEGGSPSKEITGVMLGQEFRDANGGSSVSVQFLTPLQVEFAGLGKVVINVLADTLWVIPKAHKPFVQIARVNEPDVFGACTISGELLKG